jgi:hypothetical protein
VTYFVCVTVRLYIVCLKVPVYIHKDIMGAELQQNSPADERAKQLYVEFV